MHLYLLTKQSRRRICAAAMTLATTWLVASPAHGQSFSMHSGTILAESSSIPLELAGVTATSEIEFRVRTQTNTQAGTLVKMKLFSSTDVELFSDSWNLPSDGWEEQSFTRSSHQDVGQRPAYFVLSAGAETIFEVTVAVGECTGCDESGGGSDDEADNDLDGDGQRR